MKLTPDLSKVDPLFLYYNLNQPKMVFEVQSRAIGSTIPGFNLGQLKALAVEVPSLNEQRAIAEVLGALDDKIAANTKLAATADALASALVQRASDSQRTETLTDLANVVMGSSPAGSSFNENAEGTVFYQGVRDFGFRFPSNRIWTTSPVRTASIGDTLVSVRAPVGRVNLADEDVCIGRGLAAATSKTGRPNVLFHLLKDSKSVWEPFEAEGTVFGSINKKQLESIRLPRVADADSLEDQLAALEASISTAVNETRTLAVTRDTLLPQLMSGKLQVKDAEAVLDRAGV